MYCENCLKGKIPYKEWKKQNKLCKECYEKADKITKAIKDSREERAEKLIDSFKRDKEKRRFNFGKK